MISRDKTPNGVVQFHYYVAPWAESGYTLPGMTKPDELRPIQKGWAALKKADWNTAKAQFEAALSLASTPEAHDGLGLAYWWLNNIEAAHDHRAQAFVAYKEQGNLARAALLASWLGREQVFLNGNSSAMQGWFARADRLLAEAGNCVEAHWHTIFRASMVASNADLERIALETIEAAHSYKDVALETFALASCGMARVALGQVSEGIAALDEAMTAATGGELNDFNVISEAFCFMLSACELSGDLVRSEHWCRAAFDFADRHQCIFLGAYCRTTYGGLLTATGRWSAAEQELTQAIQTFDSGHRALRVHAVLKLADLRVSQGRLEEAEILLQGYEDHGTAVLPLARLHLARGETDLARAVLQQALQTEAVLTLHHAPLLVLLSDIRLAAGDTEAAQQASKNLHTIAEQSKSELMLAQSDLVRGKILARTGSKDASACFQSALNRLKPYEQSLLASRVRLEMARLLIDEDKAGAITWARAALASFERMGATQDVTNATQLLRQLGVVARQGQQAYNALTDREAEVLPLLAQGLTNREIAEKLVISAKTVEHHVSQILAKLGARNRAEAVALAQAAKAAPQNKGRK